MALTPGSRIGSYEIVSALGAGGMGEVYRATDTVLKRQVALKILPPGVATDPDRVARFQREAEVLAALNHPNIAHLYGIERSEGTLALAMELVEGPTLADRIAQGPLAIAEALPIARQIAEALETAHDQGIIHRDLKPANIKVRADGTVKVLDFGLAKALEPTIPSRAATLTSSPTLTTPAMTAAGIILGTAAYMSPEQARGTPVDRRADIWAFGCVLFEMLTGKQPFEGGETVSDAIAAILRAEIDWTALPKDTPPHVQSILRRCLQKDARKRLPHIGVVRVELDDPTIATPPISTAAARVIASPRPTWKRVVYIAVVAVAAAALAAVTAWVMKPSPSRQIVRFPILLAQGQTLSGTTRQTVTVSPDGSQVAFVAGQQLYVRALGEAESRPIPGAQMRAGNAPLNPVFSPDGQWIAFVSVEDRAIKKVALSGGAAVTICSFEGNMAPFGISWDGDTILFELAAQILRVPASGGKPEVLVALRPGELVHGPQMLPDGQTLLFTIADSATGGSLAESWAKGRVVAQSLKSGQRTVLVDGGTEGRYLPTGHIAYALRGVLYAIPFDAKSLQVSGGAVPLVEGIRTESSTVQFSTSANGTLVYAPGSVSDAALSDLALLDRKGVAEPLRLPVGMYATPRVSPDGKHIAFTSDDGKEKAVFIHDLDGKGVPRRLTFGGKDQYPAWSADGQRVAFQSDREGDGAIFWQPADGMGSAERLTKPEPGTVHVPDSWSSDGRTLLVEVAKGSDVSLWRMSFPDRKLSPFEGVHSTMPINATFSPDGHWVAYTASSSTTARQILIQPFPPTGAQFQVTRIGGLHPAWSSGGKEILYTPARQQLEVVSVTAEPTPTVSPPLPLPRGLVFDGGPKMIRPFDVMPDGRVLGLVPAGQDVSNASARIEVVINWFEEVKQRVATR